MKVIRIQATQAHAVPDQVLEARGPFARYEPEIDHTPIKPWFPPGATAQNNMQEVHFYECNACKAVVREADLDDHQC